MFCYTSRAQACRSCSYTCISKVEQKFPGASIIGLAAFSEALDRQEDEAYPFVDSFHIDSLHARAEEEYDNLQGFDKLPHPIHLRSVAEDDDLNPTSLSDSAQVESDSTNIITDIVEESAKYSSI